MHTTLNKILQHAPDPDLWRKLLHSLGKYEADDEPLSLLTLHAICDLDETFWLLCAVDGHDAALRRLACKLAPLTCWEQVWPKDQRVQRAVEIASQYATGAIGRKELKAARVAVFDAFTAAGQVADSEFNLLLKNPSRDTTIYTTTAAASFAAHAAWMATHNEIRQSIAGVAYSSAEALLYHAVQTTNTIELASACSSDAAFAAVFLKFEPLLLETLNHAEDMKTGILAHAISGVEYEQTFDAA